MFITAFVSIKKVLLLMRKNTFLNIFPVKAETTSRLNGLVFILSELHSAIALYSEIHTVKNKNERQGFPERQTMTEQKYEALNIVVRFCLPALLKNK